MLLEQTFDLPFSRETAWAAFHDVSMLVSCLPGASLASAPGAEPLQFGLAVKLGPIAASFAGRGSITYGSDFTGVLAGGGTDRATGSRVKGSAAFVLEEKGGGTAVRLSIDYSLAGTLAQFGRSGIAKELAAGITRQFAANLRTKLAAIANGAAPAAGEAVPKARLNAGPLLWNALKRSLRSRGANEGSGQKSDKDRDELSGLQALVAVRPQWTRLAPAADVVSLEGRWLLHAGPPLADPSHPPAPILSSAVLACLYEGWAANEGEAESLVRSGAVQLRPAQDHRCVTPLACLVTPSTSMIVVEDSAVRAPPAFAPLGTVGGPDLRFGTHDAAILDRLSLRDGEHAVTLRAMLGQPIDLLAIAAAALANGDDLHNQTTAATGLLVSRLRQACRDVNPESSRRAVRLLDDIAATPLYFLTFWMAAAKVMLSAAEMRNPVSLVTRMGGNGEAFGLSLAGEPTTWVTQPATAPQGAFLSGVDPAAESLGAIGDSAIIDALGFGGQALQHAPGPRAALAPFLPQDASGTAGLLAIAHPAFAETGIRVGIDAQRVAEGASVPVVTLAMVEKTGRLGLLGRGVYLPGTALFARAVEAIAAHRR